MKISITRALAEIKTLKARYQTAVTDLKPIAVRQGNKLRGSYTSYKPEDFEAQAVSSIKSVEALYSRLIKIKTLIDQSNSQTIVNIAGRPMTIQEALAMKGFIEQRKTLLSVLKNRMTIARREYDVAIDDNKKRVEKTVADQTASSATRDPELEKKAVESIDAIYAVDFVDPLELQTRIETLQKEIEDFENNVDYALSESNSITLIEIPD